MQNKDERARSGAMGGNEAPVPLFKASYMQESGRLPVKANVEKGNERPTDRQNEPVVAKSVSLVNTSSLVATTNNNNNSTTTSRRRARRSRSLPTNVYGQPSEGVKVSKQRPHSSHFGRAAKMAAGATAYGNTVRTTVLRDASGNNNNNNNNATSGIPMPSTPLAELPPVNLESLREIDLTEIFKNPQLRHDIVFDAQLQFRPNMDGERGRRKRAAADRYWDAVAAECAQIGQPGSGARLRAGRLPLLFTTLREILVSLLPTRNREQMDAVLDTDLLMQQLEHCALDFVDFAEWLAVVFKTHCAPMRDCWVDQMVARFRLGVESGSHTRLVEGLRMAFAILEAMKLDVANHQIRTLRPMLVDSAIEFEQEYYNQVLLNGRANFADALKWYDESGRRYAAARARKLDQNQQDKPQAPACGADRAAFIWSVLQLVTCASDDRVVVASASTGGAHSSTEFPSTFGFDFGRLSGLRAELRRIVCLQLVTMLYQQMLQAEVRANNGRATGTRTPMAELKRVVVAIVSDSVGNAKWTKSIPALALELAKRVSQTVHGATDDLPDSRLVDLALGWLSKQLQPKSPLYDITEKRVVESLYDAAVAAAPVPSPLDGAVLSTGVATNSLNADAPTFDEMTAFVDRLLVLVRFHWGVFGRYYNGAAQQQPPSGLLAHTAGLPLVVEESDGAVKPAGGRMRQPSTC